MTALVAKKEKGTTSHELKHDGDRIKDMLAGRSSLSIGRIEKDFVIRRHLEMLTVIILFLQSTSHYSYNVRP